MNRSAHWWGKVSSLLFGGEGVLIHPPINQGDCGRHGTEDQRVTPGELAESLGGTEASEPISASEVASDICIDNLYPAAFPKIHQIASDVPGRTLVVIEVDESIEAPHAIETQRVHDTPYLDYVRPAPPKVSVTICPVMPKGPICSTADCWEFLSKMRQPQL